jgi:hypothetical protein
MLIAEAAILLGQRARQQPQLPAGLDDRSRGCAALIGIVRGWPHPLGGIAPDGLDDQLLFVVGSE